MAKSRWLMSCSLLLLVIAACGSQSDEVSVPDSQQTEQSTQENLSAEETADSSYFAQKWMPLVDDTHIPNDNCDTYQGLSICCGGGCCYWICSPGPDGYYRCSDRPSC